jgi:3-hydroxyisobutyrate dehydrogenase-like beta-hydroxyacid dehydrogenase
MAKNLLDSGFTLHLYNRSFEKLRSFNGTAARVFEQPDKAVREADIVITMLSDDAALNDISATMLPLMKPGSIHLSMSTISPATALSLEALHREQNITYLSAPVMGRPPAAQARQLFILLSGDAQGKEKVKPILESLGQRIFDYGDKIDAAPTVKVMVNFMIFAITEMLSETMLLAERSGIGKQQFLDMMTSTLFGAPVIKLYGGMIIEEQDNPNGFAVKLASKDLRLFQETSSGVGLGSPLAELVQKHLQEMISDGGGQKDLTQLVTHLRNTLGGK